MKFDIFRNFRRKSRGEIALYCAVSALFMVVALSYIYVLFWMVMAACKTHMEVVISPFALPEKWHWSHFIEAISLLEVNGHKFFDMLKKELVENEECSWLFKKGILKIDEFPGAYKSGERIEAEDQKLPSALLEVLEESEDEAMVEDASANALGLRNLFRQGKIGKDQYIAGLATLVAAGAITKSEFTGLKASAN